MGALASSPRFDHLIVGADLLRLIPAAAGVRNVLTGGRTDGKLLKFHKELTEWRAWTLWSLPTRIFRARSWVPRIPSWWISGPPGAGHAAPSPRSSISSPPSTRAS